MSAVPDGGGAPSRVTFDRRVNVAFPSARSPDSVVFFGRNLGPTCLRCGAFGRTSMGHAYCAQLACPIALIETHRRRRKRTSNLEKVYVPRIARTASAEAPHEPPPLGA